ncbi:hypothetical protein SKAU_G00299760 [Synaphobranchus kaupii]|uniref:Scaffolding anchor of CK1 domain-containing protein n=1 Tax=Synaphobranchus kaupii TaxID=118154 RepID=A0A9Q1EVF5_SYNKA|nr:hypothetical protein SKAU_G00299760 [Synaphobranchus kaupii]
MYPNLYSRSLPAVTLATPCKLHFVPPTRCLENRVAHLCTSIHGQVKVGRVLPGTGTVMAESQLMCMDDDHVNEKVPESKPEFYYSEEQRAAIEQLVNDGDGAFKMRLKDDKVKDFLSAREVKWIRKTFREYDTDGDTDKAQSGSTKESKADSGVHSTYWPELSDTEIPPLDIGWPDGGFYKGVTRVTVHTHPPKQNGPHIKEVVRRLIQESNKVIAVVMDLLTDLQILQDLLDAAAKRSVSVYIVLDAPGIPHFLDMCSRLQVSPLHLRNIRVRTVEGCGLALSQGKLPGSLCSKYMLVDGDKVMFGSYSFTWNTYRMDRNTITVMTGQVIDVFDTDFRELYAVSESVDLYKEFHITKPPKPVPFSSTASIRSTSMITSRFQVSLGNSRQANFKVPAHKFLQSSGGSEKPDELTPLPMATAAAEPHEKDSKKLNGPSGKKQRSSFRLFLKGKAANQSVPEDGEITPTPSNSSPTRKGPGAAKGALEDSFEVLVPERPSPPKTKIRKKLSERSISLQAVNQREEDGSKGRKRHPKKTCIQS